MIGKRCLDGDGEGNGAIYLRNVLAMLGLAVRFNASSRRDIWCMKRKLKGFFFWTRDLVK